MADLHLQKALQTFIQEKQEQARCQQRIKMDPPQETEPRLVRARPMDEINELPNYGEKVCERDGFRSDHS